MIKKITFLTLFSIIYFVHSSHAIVCVDNNYEFTTPITADQTSDYSYEDTIFNDIQYIANGTVIDDISYDGWRFNSYQSESGVYPAGESLTNDINSGIRLYTADSSNFKFYSIDYLIDLRTLTTVDITFYGFRDGVQVESITFTVPDDEIGTFNIGWEAVDEIRLASPSMYIFFDNFSIGAAGAVLTPATHLHFDGTNDYVDIANPFTSFNNEISVEFWLKRTGNITTGSGFGQATPSSDSMTTNVWLVHGNSNNSFTFFVNDGGTWKTSGESLVIPLNMWTHVAAVADSSGVRIFIDGVLNVESANGITTSILSNASASLHLGKDVRYNSDTGRNLNAEVDDLRIWNVARATTEIFNNKNCELQGNEVGLVGYYKFNQGDDAVDNMGITALTDTTASANGGTLTSFTLNGNTSNWLAGSSVVTGSSCNTLSNVSFDTSNNINLYPNPLKEEVFIKVNNLENTSLDVYDVSGRLVLSKKMTSSLNTLNISNFEAGIYLFKVISKEGEIIKKMIKN